MKPRPTPLTLPTGYELPTSGLIAIGVKGERVCEWWKPDGCRTVTDRCEWNRCPTAPPSWAQEMADDRPVRVECGCACHTSSDPDVREDAYLCDEPGCEGERFRTVGSAAVLAVVPVVQVMSGGRGAALILGRSAGPEWVNENGVFRLVHFPSAADYDWALVAQMKETSS